jgi:hypothetical protein
MKTISDIGISIYKDLEPFFEDDIPVGTHQNQ